MNFPTAHLLLLAVGLLIQPVVTAAPAARLPTTFDVTTIDAFLAAQVREASRVGLSVAVVRDGQVVLARVAPGQ
jgi:CubicO group peptidase (beta-lactamase class C family)